MAQSVPFGEVLEAADKLSPDEQEELVAVLNRRLARAGRMRVATEIQDARREFADGRCCPTSVDDLMNEILQ
jgi:hypothetical protein